jgi:uncharacterized protein (DUF433 family)
MSPAGGALNSIVRRGRPAVCARRLPALSSLPMEATILSAPDILGGTPCFAGTRVPFQTLLDYLEAGQPLDEFLADFPSVSRAAAVAALQQAGDMVSARARTA